MKKHDTFIIEYENGQWWTYAYVPSIHDDPDHDHYLVGSEDVFDTLDEAVNNIKAWRELAEFADYARQLPHPSPASRVLWEDFGEYHVETVLGQLTTNSFDEALSLACIESESVRNIN